MSTIQMRPTFELESSLEPDEVLRCLRESLLGKGRVSAAPRFRGKVAGNHAMISVDEQERRVWSPWLHLEIHSNPPGSRIQGRFSPSPSIWTAIMFSYLAIAVIVFFAAMFGIAQQLSGQTPWSYWAIPAGLVIALGLWLIAKMGQKLAGDQMQQMLDRLPVCLAGSVSSRVD